MALLLEPQSELRGQRRLAGTLQAGEHDHRWWPLGETQHPGFAAQNRDQFVIDDLDHLLSGIEGSGELSAAGTLFNGGNEVLDDGQIHIGFEEGNPDLTSRRVDICLGQPALAAQILEGGRQAVLQGVEHERPYFGCAGLTQPTQLVMVPELIVLPLGWTGLFELQLILQRVELRRASASEQ